MHAIWLCFSKNDREYLKNIINRLSEKYQTPKFEPHITVYGLMDSEINLIDKVVEEIAINAKSSIVTKSEILQSEDLWKTVYVELKINNQLESIHRNLKNNFERISKYEFKPHISLIYKFLPRKEKLKIIEGLDIKNSFIVDKIAIQKFFTNIEKWKIVKEYELG
jgi:2'-5' RNA ligase